jgi:hypothetical protein
LAGNKLKELKVKIYGHDLNVKFKREKKSCEKRRLNSFVNDMKLKNISSWKASFTRRNSDQVDV